MLISSLYVAALTNQAGAIPVRSVTGLFTAAGIWTAVIGGTVTVLVAALKIIPRWVENRKAADDSLRKDLLMRVESLEKTIEAERKFREQDRARYDAERARHDAQMALMRHRLNNSDQCLDALLMLLETSPEKVADAVKLAKEMRVRQRAEEALEKATMRGNDIAAKEAIFNEL